LPIAPLPQPTRRHRLALADGDQLALRIHEPGDVNSTNPRAVVLLFHGLGGSADSAYMQICGRAALEMGLIAVLVNLRNAGEGLELAKGLYHSGSAPDLAQVVEWARHAWPTQTLIAAGFSLSANLVLNLASGRAARGAHAASWGLADATIAVNPPIDLNRVAEEIVRPSNLIYDQSFVGSLRGLVREKVRLGHLAAEPAWPRLMRLTDFDDLVTAPAAGYRSRHDYYTDCSSRDHLHRIDRPCLILMPEDDPFIPLTTFHNTRYSAAVRLHFVETGGHLGYLKTVGRGRTQRWLGEFFSAAVSELLQTLQRATKSVEQENVAKEGEGN
jgi:hypothetical protein